MPRKWYVVQTYSGFEIKVKEMIKERMREHNVESLFGEILIPVETVCESLSGGKSKVSQKTSFPGYLFIEMEISDTSWRLVCDTPKVTRFIGNQKPQEVPLSEIRALKNLLVEGSVKPKNSVSFDIGEEILVTSGAFVNFKGIVEDTKIDRQKLKVRFSIFGRDTPIELSFSQVEKIIQ